MDNIIDDIRAAFRKRVLFTIHALNQMNTPDRMISRQEVYEVIEKGGLIEDYPDDPRGHSALIGCRISSGRWIHVVCSPRREYLGVVTAYIPDVSEWEEDMRTRRKR